MKRPRGNRRSKVLVENDMIALVERMQLRNEDAKDAGKALGIPATTAQRLARKGLRRVLLAAAQEKIKAIADADSNPIPTMQGQYELPEPEPGPSSAFNDDPEMGGKKPAEDLNLATATAMELHDTGHLEGSPQPQAHLPKSDLASVIGMYGDPNKEPPLLVVRADARSSEPTPEPVEPEPEPWPWGHLMSREEFLKRDPWRQQQLIAQWEENIALGGVWTPVLRGGPKNRTCFRGCPSYQCTCEDNL